MMVIPILFVLVCQCHGFAEQVPDTATIQNQDPLEDKLTSLLRDHEATTASLLRIQDDKWASLLRDQEAKTASLLREQEAKMIDLTSQLQQQGQKLFEQERWHRQLEQKVSDQEDLLRLQDQKLSHPESLLHEQGRVIQRLKNTHATDIPQPEKTLPGTTSGPAPLDVIPRSDDGGPLETVVSQISQRVTEMGADIQVFKTQTSGDIQTLLDSNTQQDHDIQDAQSSTFVHWGSSTCSSLSHTVYSGVLGGSHGAHSGAATNYLCLTMSPVFSDHAVRGAIAYLYGGGYATYDSYQGKDPVCAVCRSSLSTTVMIPGTNVCTPGWHLQFSGFLMAGWSAAPAGSEYICVDSRLESNIHGDDARQDSAGLHYTVTHCGSLPCTPYVDNKVVTCAVCSK